MAAKHMRGRRASGSGRSNAIDRSARVEFLEVRQLLSAVAALTINNDEAPFASARMLRHQAHAAHENHVRHLRQPALQADKADYLPGEVAFLSGHGFQAGEAVTIQVSHVSENSDSVGSTVVATWVIRADKHGGVDTSYLVQNNDLNQSLAVTATGQQSGRVAKALFEDGTTATVTSVTSSTPASTAPVLRPDHVLIVMEEDRACGAIGDTTNMPYFNQLAANSLVYTNSQGLNTSAQMGEMNYLAMYSGSTQGVTDDGRGYSFSGANLGQTLNNAGLSFVGYAESLPSDGSEVQQAADPTTDPADHPDLYMRSYNAPAMFTNAGNGKTNADVNKRFAEFPTNYANLPTVSLVIPNNLHNAHGSNESPPYATDPSSYVPLRQAADAWMRQNLDAYVQWAKTHNSLLIITTDEQDRAHTSLGLTTLVTGDPRLFVAGTDSTNITHYNILREIENMYGLTLLGNTASNPGLDVNAQGQLAPGAGSSGAGSVYGQSVTFSAKVSPTRGTGVPTGTVQFKIDGANFGSAKTLSGGAATSAAITSLAPGNHTVTAVYAGSRTFGASTSSAISQAVAKDSSATSLSSSAASSPIGQPVTFTAKVAVVSPGTAKPTGSVSFVDGGTTLATVAVDSTGTATYTTSSLSTGTHSVTASYGGDVDVGVSSSTAITENITGSVTAASTTTSVSASASSTVYGQAITFSATISSGVAGTPTGSVQFYVDGNAFGSPVALINASATSAADAALPPGNHSITAVYSGDSAYSGSTSSATGVTVNKAGASTALTASPNPSTAGQSVTLSASVSAAAPGAGTPSGSVQFVVDGANFGAAVALSNGSASLSTTSLATGSHTITANYLGDANFTTSGSNSVSQTVNAATGGLVNDMFATATVITTSGATTTLTGTNVGATKEAGEPNHAGNTGGKSVWYSWTPATNTNVTLDTSGSTFDTLLAVYTGSSVSALTQVAANDDSPAGGTATSQLTFSAIAGTTYRIAVDGYGGASGSITLHLNTGVSIGPVNNNFTNATTITGSSATVTGSNVGATKETGEPAIAGNSGGKSVWWAWTAPASGTATIDTLGSSFDTLLGVYTGSSVSALTQIAANDDSLSGGTTTSKVTFSAVAGTTYMIAVDGYAGASGSITMHVSLV